MTVSAGACPGNSPSSPNAGDTDVALAKMRIIREKKGSARKEGPSDNDFDKGSPIYALFNPDYISYSGSIGWSKPARPPSTTFPNVPSAAATGLSR